MFNTVVDVRITTVCSDILQYVIYTAVHTTVFPYFTTVFLYITTVFPNITVVGL